MKKEVFLKILGITIVFAIIMAGSVYAVNSNSKITTKTEEPAITEDVLSSTTQVSTASESKDENHDLGLIAAALATGLSCLGAGIAVAVVASSAVGAISENPALLGKTIIFGGLAEGIAIYGLIISIMILNKI